jgi:two-component system cell cycle response regulator DivK
MATILIIEDDPNSINILKRVLERAGHNILCATEGLNGVRVINQQPVDLVLLDMGLPDLGGHTVAALIKRIPGSVPIVAVSASTDVATERRAMSYGCAGYITKPINTRTFADQIAPYLTGSTGRSETTQSAEKPESPDTSENDDKVAGSVTPGNTGTSQAGETPAFRTQI